MDSGNASNARPGGVGPGRRPGPLLAAALAVAVTAALLLAPVPTGRLGPWQDRILDLGHVPLFAALVLSWPCGPRAAHPDAADEVSGYYLADELAGTSRGMAIAIGPKAWAVFTTLGDAGLARLLKEIAGRVKVARYRRHPRGPKKPPGPRRRDRGKPHVATARLLAERKIRGK